LELWGGIWSKIGQEKRPTHYPQSEGEEERAEKERGEEVRERGRIPHKDFSPKQNQFN